VALLNDHRITEIGDCAPVAEELEPFALELGRSIRVAGVRNLYREPLYGEHVT
jgi:hypothetical protein